MNVLHIITDLDVGGAEVMLATLIGHTPELSHSVVSLTTAGPVAADLERHGVRVEAAGMRRRPTDALRLPALRRRIRSGRPDVVHTWMIHANILAGSLARRVAPVIWGLHHTALDPTSTPRATIALDRWSARLSSRVPTRIVSCSRAALASHREAGYAADRIVHIPNGVDADRFVPDPGARAGIRAELGVPDDVPLIGMVARWDAQKDHANFVAAATATSEALPDAHFVLAGHDVDPTNRELDELVRRFGGRFRLLGERTDTPAVLAALDLAVLSSAYGEAAPMVLLEALACGVPCVATDLGDCADIVGSNGIVVAPRDPRALAAAMATVIAGRDRYASGAREHVVGRFSVGATAAAYTDLYRQVRTP